jgi:hypothetical protein
MADQRSKGLKPSGRFSALFSRDDNHRDQVEQQARNTSRNEGDEECQTDPERADAEKFSQPAADTRDDAVAARTS